MSNFKIRPVMLSILLFAGFGAAEVRAGGGANAGAATAQANSAIQGVGACEVANRGQALIDCVGNTMASLSQGLSFAARGLAPELATLAAKASEIRGKPKAEARLTLNGVIAIYNGLRAKSASDIRPVIDAVGKAFDSALRAVERRG